MPENTQNIISVFDEVEHFAVTDELITEAAAAIDKALKLFFEDKIFAVSLTVTDDKSIKLLNNEYRQIDKATDVLSFPQYEFYAPLDVADDFVVEDGAIILGDIIISAETALRQSEEYCHSFKREFIFLCIHSLLHLLGFDHIEEADKIVMEEQQDEIMEILEVSR